MGDDLDALVRRLRDTPNWLKQDYGNYKSSTSRYDRDPFAAADMLEAQAATITQLRADLDAANERVEKAEAALNAPNRHAYKCGIAVGNAKAEALTDRMRMAIADAANEDQLKVWADELMSDLAMRGLLTVNDYDDKITAITEIRERLELCASHFRAALAAAKEPRHE